MRNSIILLILVLLSVSHSSCKKDSIKKSKTDDCGYCLTAQFADTNKVFTAAYATKTPFSNNDTNLLIAGRTDTSELEISLWSAEEKFAVGKTYATSLIWTGMNNGMIYYLPLGSTAPTALWNTTFPWTTVDQQFSCTITELTTTYISGTFSGLLYQLTDGPGLTIKVINGKFHAQFM